MRRIYVVLIAALASTASISAVASAQGGTPTAHASRATTIELGHTRLGSILTTSSGFTLYEFSKDRTRENSCVKIKSCSGFWPALESSGNPTAGAGVQASLLSTIQLSGGARQVTYAGHALYLYSGDSGPRSTSYVGAKQFGGTWDALGASGQLVR